MRTVVFLTILAWTGGALAQGGATKANALTSKEISDGWLLLFDGDTAFGWQGAGSIKAVDGGLEIKGDGAKPAVARPSGHFQDFEAYFEYATKGKNASVTGFGENSIELKALASEVPPKAQVSSWAIFQGRLGHGQPAWSVPAGSVLNLKNVKLRPLKLTPIFNGKDLTGWKEFPGKRSKFTVNAQGDINIKNGPGDLQTEGKYDDFVLQLDCISNGKHLNSGVFFRCRPNEYQNGYEAQIHNGFGAPKDYTLEEYDPRTHKLVGKRKEKFTAIDYGTGAIYRRQPARKEVAKDGDWFTFTVVADKNRLMTWVNGIQVVDWVDNRPSSDNARNGCRLEAGHISLQGHDPTTDLSFRNIRIGQVK